MILNILPNGEEQSPELNVYTITSKYLTSPVTHLFIASNHWDTVNIHAIHELTNCNLKCLYLTADCIKVKLPDLVTSDIAHSLIELYPDLSGALRRCLMTGGSFKEVIPECNQL